MVVVVVVGVIIADGGCIDVVVVMVAVAEGCSDVVNIIRKLVVQYADIIIHTNTNTRTHTLQKFL